MKEQYKISVLITFYNQEKYVDECLESVFSQKTTFPFKVIVGDDGSTDGTLEKVQKWIERYPERLSVLQMPREAGKKYVGGTRASQNRLALLDRVDTKYFHFLDGDDYWTDENKLQIEYDILEKTENRDCVGCAHSIKKYHENNLASETEYWGADVSEGKYSLKKYWGDMYFHTNTILFRSENIGNLQIELIRDSFNDNLITYSFMQFGKIYFTDKCMAAYRQNDNGIWAGESRIISVIRELILYDIELKINPKMKNQSKLRHLDNFIFIYNNKEYIESLSDYYDIAKKYDLPITKRVIEHKYIFSKWSFVDWLIIWKMRIARAWIYVMKN